MPPVEKTIVPSIRQVRGIVATATMFVAEMVAGVAGGTKALQADALDFLGDAANYAISLGVAGMALGWRARAALFKGVTLVCPHRVDRLVC